MDKFLVSGLINIEIAVKVEKFPVEYSPVLFPFFGIKSSVSGVAVNIARALSILGSQAEILSLIGDDEDGNSALSTLEKYNLNTSKIFKTLKETPQSVILYDPQGKRQINCDLKDIQDASYPEDIFIKELKQCSMAILTPLNFSRKLLKHAKDLNIPIATDLHVQSNIFDDYCKEFFQFADILFLSNEAIMGRERDFVNEVANEYGAKIIVVGMGAEGALLYVRDDNFMEIFNSIKTREIINTVGAGDSLFSCFLHYYNKTGNPYISLRKAIIFASWKIGDSRAAHGFLDENQLEELYEKNKNNFIIKDQ